LHTVGSWARRGGERGRPARRVQGSPEPALGLDVVRGVDGHLEEGRGRERLRRVATPGDDILLDLLASRGKKGGGGLGVGRCQRVSLSHVSTDAPPLPLPRNISAEPAPQPGRPGGGHILVACPVGEGVTGPVRRNAVRPDGGRLSLSVLANPTVGHCGASGGGGIAEISCDTASL